MEFNPLIHLMFGPLLLTISLLYKAFPPKKINYLYGYRTSRSMKSEQAWQVANKMSAHLMMWASLLTCAAQAVLYATGMSVVSYMGWSSGIMVVALLATLPPVETHLKKNFDDQGRPI